MKITGITFYIFLSKDEECFVGIDRHGNHIELDEFDNTQVATWLDEQEAKEWGEFYKDQGYIMKTVSTNLLD